MGKLVFLYQGIVKPLSSSIDRFFSLFVWVGDHYTDHVSLAQTLSFAQNSLETDGDCWIAADVRSLVFSWFE